MDNLWNIVDIPSGNDYHSYIEAMAIEIVSFKRMVSFHYVCLPEGKSHKTTIKPT